MCVEEGKAEVSLLQPFENDAGYEETGNDKKDVYADKPARQAAGKGVINDNRQYGNRTQAVDVRPV